MRIEVDARGEACPKPVIMTKKELDKVGEGVVTTIVDNEVAKDNVSKLANSLGFEYNVDEVSDREFHITITKGEAAVDTDVPKSDDFKDLTVAFASDTMGKGSEELGKILIKSFVYTLTEATPYPSTLIFYNGGVHLTCEGSEVLEDLKKLEEEGVEIISCGTCLDFFGIKDKLQVGEISNMYTIYEKLRNPMNTVTIG
ncbi:sulfurtransferase-like selenium metabolism protein YedF [Clostridium sp. Cult3]|uniref:sulfurtransferase-like selenium metabolism protein YedF n=1 Tax=Clostridium sp. Cult3 TaxID=2079004 RepID=UPI001F2EB468|nr:sulfurtransferase-like selenium metabolism protein YedF [Clostridium sp. Cult3]MCF6460974.1 sulfurtransferase-like selenium metabolism protein YedF [Clostridium sp. Cult3]